MTKFIGRSAAFACGLGLLVWCGPHIVRADPPCGDGTVPKAMPCDGMTLDPKRGPVDQCFTLTRDGDGKNPRCGASFKFRGAQPGIGCEFKAGVQGVKCGTCVTLYMCGIQVVAVIPELGVCGQKWDCTWLPDPEPDLAALGLGECKGDAGDGLVTHVPINCNTCLVLMVDTCTPPPPPL